jgi:dihydroorotase
VAGARERLEGFAGLQGPGFYGLEPNEGTMVLERVDVAVAVAPLVETGAGPVVVFDPGAPLHWRVVV